MADDESRLDLEARLQRAYVAQGVTADKQASTNIFLQLLDYKHAPTYLHSLRVGLLASEIGEFLHLDGKALLYAGLLHDIGKALVNIETLTMTEGFKAREYEEMKLHPEYAYRLIRGIHDFTADIVLRHHRYQTGAYPEHLPPYRHPYSNATRATIDFSAMILALADSYDAARTRMNDKHGEVRALSRGEVKKYMLENHLHFRKLIDDLYRNGIFEDEPVAPTPIQAGIEDEANREINSYAPRGVRRNVQVALALEPISEKPGCTTRSRDCSRHLKLEYFIAGAVNVGDAFEDLVIRLQHTDGQPELYGFAVRAQLDSKKNRGGGRINEGMIEMLTPIVAAQQLYNRDRTKSVQEVLQHTADVLRNTTPEDVRHLLALKRLSYDLCAYHDRKVKDHDARTVLEFYQQELAAANRPVSRLHNAEILGGFPTTRRIYDLLVAKPDADISERMREAYLSVREQEHKDLAEGGLTADLCGVALYLLFSEHPDSVIVR